MFQFALFLLAAEPVDCPPRGSMERQEQWYPGKICRDDYERQLEMARQIAEGFEQPGKPVPPLSAPEKAEIARQLDLKLVDGASVRFLWPKRVHRTTFCGFVNAKNSLGGYVGWRLFSANIGPTLPNEKPVILVSYPAMPEFCSLHRYPTDPADLD